ncbi:MAG: IS256 family transposase, partial [Candidatus Bathyarchaeota archaeon]|nr:IS256 family transposase [Candidatus Bathyarchaeota archaeon]
MSVKELTNITLTDLWKEYKRINNFWEAEEEAAKAFRKIFIESALEEERTMLIGCTFYERKAERNNYRNGYWRRWITLKDGRLEVRMPRIRGMRYESKIIPRYKQRVKEVDAALLKIFLYGASTRLTGEALKPLMGEGISAQTISNISKSLDEELERYHNRKLEDKYLYLFLDGIVLKKRSGFGAKKRVVLVAYGIRIDGKRELIDFAVTNAESEKKWWRFLNNLYRRGMNGESLGLVTTDGNAGLENAVDLIWPFVKRQRCWAHKLRNVAKYLKKKDLDICIKEARAIYNANNKREAERAYSKWEKKWITIAPKAVKCIEKDLEELLNFYSCPKAIWVKLRTTNVIERAFREVRKRTRPMSCFNNDQSIERIVYAVLIHLNEQWGK